MRRGIVVSSSLLGVLAVLYSSLLPASVSGFSSETLLGGAICDALPGANFFCDIPASEDKGSAKDKDKGGNSKDSQSEDEPATPIDVKPVPASSPASSNREQAVSNSSGKATKQPTSSRPTPCLLYTSDAADE